MTRAVSRWIKRASERSWNRRTPGRGRFASGEARSFLVGDVYIGTIADPKEVFLSRE